MLSSLVRETVAPLFVSNSHPHHIAALAVALQEILDFGAGYSVMVVANARRLAAELGAGGAEISFPERGYTDCHQFFWAIGSRQDAFSAWTSLEEAGLHTNLIRVPFRADVFGFRIGVAEMTRRGATPSEMGELAALLLMAAGGCAPGIGRKVSEFSRRFPGVHYGYDTDGSALPGTPAESPRQ